MKRLFYFIVTTAFTLTTFSSCFDGVIIEGNNEISEEDRTIPDFESISSAGSFDVYYTQGEETSVKVVCESNLIPYIETAVFNNNLNIRTAIHTSIYNHHPIEVYVTSPSVNRILLSGSGKIETDSVSSQKLSLEVSGSGNIYSNFYGGHFSSIISGSGSMYLSCLCDTVETLVSGSGHIDLVTGDCLSTSVTISGSGKAILSGSSNYASYQIVGSGKILAYDFPVSTADVLISGSGNVYITVSDYLNAILSGSGNIHYKGRPVINFNASSSGNLIPEN